MLLADDKGAALIVAVGTHATLVEFLDKGRAGMASTFLTRLRVGGKLVDAKGVSAGSTAADLRLCADPAAGRGRARWRRGHRGGGLHRPGSSYPRPDLGVDWWAPPSSPGCSGLF